DQRGLDQGGTVDDVIVGEHQAVGVEDHPGAFGRLALVIERGRDVGDPRLHLGRDGRDVECGAGVAVVAAVALGGRDVVGGDAGGAAVAAVVQGHRGA